MREPAALFWRTGTLYLALAVCMSLSFAYLQYRRAERAERSVAEMMPMLKRATLMVQKCQDELGRIEIYDLQQEVFDATSSRRGR